MSADGAGPPMEFPPPRNPDDLGRGPMIMGITWPLTILAVVAATVRMYVRRKTLLIDDWLMAVAAVLQLLAMSLVSVSVSYGFGKHAADLQMPDELINILKYNWAHTAPGMMTSIIARISITILLVRLFGVHKWFKWFMIILTTLQVAMGTSVLICTWTQTKPVEGMWNVFIPDIERWDPNILLYQMYLGQSLYTFADLTYVVIPVAFIWKLNMPLQRRIGLIAVMTVGLVTVFFSIMKTITSTSGESDNPDFVYDASTTVIWANGEQACVVLLGCVPPLRSAAAKQNFLSFKSVGNSLSSLLGTRASNWTRGPNSTNGARGGKSSMVSGGSGAYHDIEMSNASKLGHTGNPHLHHDVEASAATSDTQSQKSLVTEGHVRRTDVFTVEYERASNLDHLRGKIP